ncbi:MAG: PD-(D/E)XK nuclease family protein [Chloroflexota bacterium]|nr:PD-(D/E)XK nuclease family protein [Chloroflexota bacterium]
MALFQRLLGLHGSPVPLEDFFTEIVAYLFTVSPDLLFGWLTELGLGAFPPEATAVVATQVRMGPLPEHTTESRLDLLIDICDGDWHEWIVIESKIGAPAMPGQLRRYAELLAAERHLRRRVLLYITRDYDPKEAAAVVGHLPTAVQFLQTQWLTFARFLRTQPPSLLRDELLQFMQVTGMVHSNQFTAADVLALTQLSTLYTLMNATLDDEVRAGLRAVTGATPRVSSADQVALRGYFLLAWPTSDVEWWCGVGYTGSPDGPAAYPTVRLHLEVSATTRMPVRRVILEAFHVIATRPGWTAVNLDRSRHAAAVYREITLRQFLLADDHVAAIKTQFLTLLAELADIRHQHATLPWGGAA